MGRISMAATRPHPVLWRRVSRTGLAAAVALAAAGAAAGCGSSSHPRVHRPKAPPAQAMPVPRLPARAPVVTPSAAPNGALAPAALSPAPLQSKAATPAAPAAIPSCTLPPSTLDPNRPVISVSFRVADDHRSVTGEETVHFTPDLPVNELVFRLWPNGPEGGRHDASLTVSDATTPGGGAFSVDSDGARAGTQGTLLHLPLGRTVAAGQSVDAHLSFTLRLPAPSWDRLGSDGRTAYWGSGFPLLAWERGVGWDTDPASPLPGETASSEAANYTISVNAPSGDTVLAAGHSSGPSPAAGGRSDWQFSADGIRDVAVTVGPLATASTTVPVGGRSVTVVAGVAPGVGMTPESVLAEAERALPMLAARFGPVPFDTIRLGAVPGLVPTGIEFPGNIFLMPLTDPSALRSVEVHELAHQWFYAEVGNDQARDPWLDEAFATYAETLLDTDVGNQPPPDSVLSGPPSPDRIGGSMASFGTDYVRYDTVVYYEGAAALLNARAASGPAAFDAVIRCYVQAEAWRISTPAALRTALAPLPVAQAVLQRAGAW